MSEILTHNALDRHLAELCDAPRWYVGFSGGLDSTALLHLLVQWCTANPEAPPLTAIHVNHGLQREAQEWESHCESTCLTLKVPYLSFAVQVKTGGNGVESAARNARYKVMENHLNTADVLFLAHHLDDQVETFFLRLMRGAGVQGLSGMPRQRALGKGSIVRPLLDVTRHQLEAFNEYWGLASIEDPSNADTSLDRNFLRAEVLPLLESHWPGYRHTVARASGHLGDAAKTLQQTLLVPKPVSSVLGDPGILVTPLLGAPYASVADSVRYWLRELGQQAPDQASLMEFVRQLQSASAGASPRLQCATYALERYRGAVYLLPAELPGLSCAQLLLRPGRTMEVPGAGVLSLQPTAGPGLQLAQNEYLKLRWRSGGERCQPVERNSSTSLKKLLQEYAVPRWWRARVPLLYLGRELVAVGGLWHCRNERWRDSAAPGVPLYKVCWRPSIAASLD